MAKRRMLERLERLVYRVAGLPVAIRASFAPAPSPGAEQDWIRRAHASRFWRLEGPSEWAELALGLLLWPVGLLGSAIWFTMRNGAAVRRRGSRSIARQFVDQLRLYFTAGILPPWYYLYSLDQDGSSARARTFVQRFETKTCLFPLLKPKGGSPLTDKRRFAEHCAAHRIRCVETSMFLDGSAQAQELPDRDLFVKPSNARGGRGAERWDRVAPHVYAGPEGQRLTAAELIGQLARRSCARPLIVQPRLIPHPALARLTAGALPTARIVTCLNEAGEPEPVATVFRMSLGTNRTVDNMHAGGIAARPDLATGKLGRGSDLGTNARLGWSAVHPDTGATIEGTVLPFWEEAKQLAVDAHRAFMDRVVIGWDISILDDGPILVEGNGSPDMDIIQRFLPTGLRHGRFGDLAAFHLQRRHAAARTAFPAPQSAPTSRDDEADGRHSHQRQADAGRAGFGAQLPPQ